MLTGHTPTLPIGMGGRIIIAGGLRIDVARDMAILANIRAPKYSASSLFLKDTTYTLDEFRQLVKAILVNMTYLNVTRRSEESMKNMIKIA